MIIYNKNKEFIGIDEADLKALGFKNLSALQAEAGDFADLFIKTPGHVHNFKHVHWIDFVLCAKSTDESKAIIHANDKNFKVNLEVSLMYLSDAPATRAFCITLHNLRALSSNEKTNISNELQTRVAPIPQATTTVVDTFDEVPIELDSEDLVQDVFDANSSKEVMDDPYAVVEQEVDIVEIDLEEEDEEKVSIYEPSAKDLEEIGEAEAETDTEDILEAIDFTFDPQKTAEALEMPVSLIEEFIEDFINQAIEFKDKLYKAVANDDMIELQALSHKLKGVAANLRVQDALEVLSKINKAKDFTTSKRDLDTLYRIISKLSGKEISPPKTVETIELQIQDTLDNDDAEDELNEILEIIDDDEVLEIIDDDYEAVEINLDDEEEEDEELLIISDDFDMLDEAMNEIIEDTDEDEVQISPNTADYDKVMVANEIGLDSSSFNELFDDYISESQNLVMSIEDAIQEDDANEWKNIAFKLKGMSDNMRINNFVKELEVLIHTKNTDEAKAALAQIQTTIFEILKTKD